MDHGTKLGLLGIYLSIFAHTLMFSTLFPVVGQTLMDFKPLIARSELGKYYSTLNGGFFLGEFLCFPIQLYLCSKLGLRLLHLLSILSTLLFSLLISYSTTYDSLITLRFLQGLCCPVIYSSLRLLKAHFPQKAENFVQRFYLLGLCAGFFLGGSMDTVSIMGSSEHLACNLVVVVLAGVSFVLCLKYGKLVGGRRGGGIEEEEEGGQGSLLGIFIEIVEAFKVKGIFQAVAVYLLCCVAGTGFDLMVLWMLASQETYGFNGDAQKLTKVLFFSSFGMLCFTFIYYKGIVSKLGSIQTCKKALKLSAICFFVIPIASIAHLNYNGMFVSLSLGCLLYFTSQLIAETAVFGLIGSLSSYNSGLTTQDVSLALSKITRALSVYLFSLSFADHVTNKSYPFNFAYTFNVMTLILGGTFLVCFTLRQADQSMVAPKPRKVLDSLLDPSVETLEIPVKSSELKVMSSNK